MKLTLTACLLLSLLAACGKKAANDGSPTRQRDEACGGKGLCIPLTSWHLLSVARVYPGKLRLEVMNKVFLDECSGIASNDAVINPERSQITLQLLPIVANTEIIEVKVYSWNGACDDKTEFYVNSDAHHERVRVGTQTQVHFDLDR